MQDNRAMTSLNLSSNALGELVLPAGWTKGGRRCDPLYKHSDGREQKRHPGEPEGIIAVVNAIKNMRALSKFDISNNNLCAAGTKALAEGLKGNQRMTELNMSSNDMGVSYRRGPSDMSGLITLANVIPGIGVLSSLNLSKNSLATKEAGKALSEALVGNSMLKELDLSSNYDGYPNHAIEFAQELAVGIKDNGTLSVLNLASNNLGQLILPKEWTKKLEKLDDKRRVVYMHADGTKQIEHPGKPEGIIALAIAIPDMGAMSKLTFGDGQVVTMTTEMTEANFSGKLWPYEAQIVAAFLSKCM
jgi:hypothetical protein